MYNGKTWKIESSGGHNQIYTFLKNGSGCYVKDKLEETGILK